MQDDENTAVTVLGMGEMGRALAAALVAGGHPTTVWNRSPNRAAPAVDPVHALIRRQIAAGHGTDAFARIYEGIRSTAA